MTRAPLRIALVYPDLLGTYGDGGNGVVALQRLQRRGIPADLIRVPGGEEVPGDADLYLLGGAEDDAQLLALRGLQASTAFVRAVQAGRPVLAVCAGMQLLGTDLEMHDGRIADGLGLLDLSTRRGRAERVVGEVVADPRPGLGLPQLTGFENHGGTTTLGPGAVPLARVVTGIGNGGGQGDEGAVQGSVLATYLHGPVLARNPDLADLLLSRALGEELAPLPLPAVEELRRERLQRVG